jgi:PAS domain S-box-containing protein
MSRRATATYLLFSLASITGMGAACAAGLPTLVAAVLAIVVAGGGAVVLRRSLAPLAAVESQLVRASVAPEGTPPRLDLLDGSGPAVAGFNRLVRQSRHDGPPDDLPARLEEALERYRRNKSDLLLNSLPEGVAVTDAQGTITLANRPLAALFGAGTDANALVGRDIRRFLFEGAAPNDGESLLSGGDLERTTVAEIRRGEASGGGVLRVARQPLRGDDGHAPPGCVWSVRDVTQQKLAERMRTDFVNSATHELRTPLANIRAYAETLAITDDLDIAQHKEFCNTINSEVGRLTRLVDDLLSIESMEVGSLALARQETNFERLLSETIGKVRPQMEQKNIHFEAILPKKFPTLLIDKDKIILTLVNLLGNATKYTPEGGKVVLLVECRDDAISIHVEDSGIGISPEDLPKVFDTFFRSADPRVQHETGSGLGLSLAREVVRLHGGKLTVQSKLDVGSTFTVVLPMSLKV